MKRILVIVIIIVISASVIYLCNKWYYNEFYAVRLTKAIKDNDLNKLEYLLSKKGNINSKTHIVCIDCRGDTTPLNVAAFNGNYEAVKLLVENGADVNNTNATNNNAPLTSALSGNTEHSIKIAKYLIEYGANINYRPNRGTGRNVLATTVYYSYNDSIDRKKEKLDFIIYLIKNNGNYENCGGYGHLIFYAAESNNDLVVDFLLENNFATIDLQNDSGYTALMFASRSGSIEVVRYLLNNGANKKLENKYGQTALDIAIENENEVIISMLSE